MLAFELQALFFSILILVLLILLQTLLLVPNQGIAWGLGSRDEPKPEGLIQGRIRRATQNHVVALMMFAPLIFILRDIGVSNGQTLIGAGLFLAARLLYPIVYALGMPVIRSLIFITGMVGIGFLVYAIAIAGFQTGI